MRLIGAVKFDRAATREPHTPIGGEEVRIVGERDADGTVRWRSGILPRGRSIVKQIASSLRSWCLHEGMYDIKKLNFRVCEEGHSGVFMISTAFNGIDDREGLVLQLDCGDSFSPRRIDVSRKNNRCHL